jgi:hypothetical protein
MKCTAIWLPHEPQHSFKTRAKPSRWVTLVATLLLKISAQASSAFWDPSLDSQCPCQTGHSSSTTLLLEASEARLLCSPLSIAATCKAWYLPSQPLPLILLPAGDLTLVKRLLGEKPELVSEEAAKHLSF